MASHGKPHPFARRIVAVVLPQLLCELALEKQGEDPAESNASKPLAVIFREEGTESSEELLGQKPIAQVNESAKRCGVHKGQTLAEAHALVSGLTVVSISSSAVTAALGRVAELAQGFALTVAVSEPDTLWLDISGVAHLMGGEQSLCEELACSVRSLGHRVRVAASCGPLLAQAFARWLSPSGRGEVVFSVPSSETVLRFGELPIQALPVTPLEVAWLSRVGLFRVGDLNHLPKVAAAARLGESASKVLALCEGRDERPLVPYQPPAVLQEQLEWETSLTGMEPLLFAAKKMTARLSARLQGRGMAAQSLSLQLEYDKSIAALRGKPQRLALRFALAAPLWRDSELLRVLRPRLEQTQLAAPFVSVSLSVPEITAAVARQLDLSRGAARVGSDLSKGPEVLPVLLAELGSDVGPEHVGCLKVQDSHRLEAQSKLGAVQLEGPEGRSGRRGSRSGRGRTVAKKKRQKLSRGEAAPRLLSRSLSLSAGPTRLLHPPVCVESLDPGASVILGSHFYTVERVAFEQRLDLVEWWTESSTSRDYVRLWLRGSRGGIEALGYMDRVSGRRFVQGIYD